VIFGTVTDPIWLLILFFFFLFLLERKSFKSLRLLGSVASNRIGMKFGNIVQVNKHRLTESDFRFDVTFTLSRWPLVVAIRVTVTSTDCMKSRTLRISESVNPQRTVKHCLKSV